MSITCRWLVGQGLTVENSVRKLVQVCADAAGQGLFVRSGFGNFFVKRTDGEAALYIKLSVGWSQKESLAGNDGVARDVARGLTKKS